MVDQPLVVILRNFDNHRAITNDRELFGPIIYFMYIFIVYMLVSNRIFAYGYFSFIIIFFIYNYFNILYYVDFHQNKQIVLVSIISKLEYVLVFAIKSDKDIFTRNERGTCEVDGN